VSKAHSGEKTANVGNSCAVSCHLYCNPYRLWQWKTL